MIRLTKSFLCPLIGASLLLFAACGEEEQEEVVEISTDYGDILIWLYDETPEHKENFLELAEDGFYDGTTFHRIIPGFMIQGGDPNSRLDEDGTPGEGGPGYKIPEEIHDDLLHREGAVAAARQPDQVNPERESSGSQFYIVHPEDGTPQLDGEYTVFGDVITGQEVVNEIANVETDAGDQPLDRVEMEVEVKEIPKSTIFEEHNFTPQIEPAN